MKNTTDQNVARVDGQPEWDGHPTAASHQTTHTSGPWDDQSMEFDDWVLVRARIVARSGGFASEEPCGRRYGRCLSCNHES